RREFMAVSAAAGATILLPGALSAALDGKKTFTILHTNDMHSAFIGMGPAADYTPFKLNDDTTRGGFARLATLIARGRRYAKSRVRCWCLPRVTTAWGQRSAPPPARPAASCNS